MLLRTWLLRWRMGVAKIVHHNVKCGEEGVHIDHEESVPFPLGSGSKPTLANGHLPLKYSPDNSHQAFKARKGSGLCLVLSADSGERPKGDLRRIHLPRTQVNKGKEKGRSCQAPTCSLTSLIASQQELRRAAGRAPRSSMPP